MLPFKTISDANLEPCFEIEEYEIGLKNNALFSKHNDEIVVCLTEEKIEESLNYIVHLKNKYEIVLISLEDFEELYDKYKEEKSTQNIDDIDDAIEDGTSLEQFLQNDDLLVEENSAPIISFVNTLFVKAVKDGTTDIHIESYETRGLVKFRIDGVLSEIANVKKSVIVSIINRIKVISHLDISETRVPQDGRTKINLGTSQIDIRVSILPTHNGEKAVLRLLMKADKIPSLEELGFNENTTSKLKGLLKHSFGMVLITGPTGSGKSTTLYSFLKNIDSTTNNITTVEDPVEYNSFGINQIQVNPKVGLTFPTALRSILRQDPDVILLGEIRDDETAAISVQAAMTGHLLLSTLHTNNAAAAIPRLMDMGVDSYLLGSTLLGVVAQRLVRNLCNNCKVEVQISESDSSFFDIDPKQKVFTNVGCANCNDRGYQGRTAIGEIITLDEGLLKIIKGGCDELEIKEYLKDNSDFISMQTQLKQMILEGITSIDEAIRIGIKEL
ncbi:MAG: type II/IV secretion system protein [Epsilonproteobacteria bacterium]|nr:MAG: type II/IV secretion system protein [Campylobacterota bacterium]